MVCVLLLCMNIYVFILFENKIDVIDDGKWNFGKNRCRDDCSF